VVNVVPTPSNEVAGLLGTDPRVDLISFTGSTAVGKLLMRQGADTMKRMFLELGGKSVSIVLDDANPAAIVGAAWESSTTRLRWYWERRAVRAARTP
jgi:aldehyde dehydrogenase (NAD+)